MRLPRLDSRGVRIRAIRSAVQEVLYRARRRGRVRARTLN